MLKSMLRGFVERGFFLEKMDLAVGLTGAAGDPGSDSERSS